MHKTICYLPDRPVSRRTILQGLIEEFKRGDSITQLYAWLLAEHLVATTPALKKDYHWVLPMMKKERNERAVAAGIEKG